MKIETNISKTEKGALQFLMPQQVLINNTTHTIMTLNLVLE